MDLQPPTARVLRDGVETEAAVEDVKAVAPSILRHRIITNFRAQAEGVTSLGVVERLLEGVRP